MNDFENKDLFAINITTSHDNCLDSTKADVHFLPLDEAEQPCLTVLCKNGEVLKRFRLFGIYDETTGSVGVPGPEGNLMTLTLMQYINRVLTSASEILDMTNGNDFKKNWAHMKEFLLSGKGSSIQVVVW